MRVLVCGDFHLGINYNGFSRLEEQKEQLGKIVGIVTRNDVSCVIVAGDVFHTNRPTTESIFYFNHFFLMPLVQRGIDVIILTGNHDYNANGKSAILTCDVISKVMIIDKSIYVDRLRGITYVPYMKSVKPDDINDIDTNVVIGHFSINGATIGAEENLLSNYVSTIHGFPDCVKWCFTGHIHKKQDFFVGNCHVYYPGSLIRCDFGEKNDEKSVIIFDTEKKEVLSFDLNPIEFSHFKIKCGELDKTVNKDSVSGKIVKLEVMDWDGKFSRDDYYSILEGLSPHKIYSILLKRPEKKINNKLSSTNEHVQKQKTHDIVKNWFFENYNNDKNLANMAIGYLEGIADEN